MQKAFKKALAERGLNRRMRANRSGCLDQCEHGPNVVIYPDGIWYGWVTHDDVNEIVESLVTGVPVERLRIADDCLNAATCPHRPRFQTPPIAP